MARPKRQTVDYFPHFVKGGRTIFILEDRFGNDGYAFWFKVLEILGEAEGHFYDCSNGSNWAFLLAKTHLTEEEANNIISVLIDLGKIDAELWAAKRILWVDNFVKNLSEVYRTRHSDLPLKPCFEPEKPVKEEVITEKTEVQEGFSTKKHTKEKESKGEERKEKKYPYQGICDLWNSVCVSLPRIAKITEARRQKIRARLDEFGCQPEEWLTTAETLFKRVQASDFLTGRKTDWKASFDWLFENGKNWVKVTEGNYDNKGCGFNRGAQTGVPAQDGKLGVGEFIDGSGRRTYGSGRATIPQDAPPRPSERHQWSAESNTWIIL